MRQQLPVGVGPDDRMPTGRREPKERPADEATQQKPSPESGQEKKEEHHYQEQENARDELTEALDRAAPSSPQACVFFRRRQTSFISVYVGVPLGSVSPIDPLSPQRR